MNDDEKGILDYAYETWIIWGGYLSDIARDEMSHSNIKWKEEFDTYLDTLVAKEQSNESNI